MTVDLTPAAVARDVQFLRMRAVYITSDTCRRLADLIEAMAAERDAQAAELARLTRALGVSQAINSAFARGAPDEPPIACDAAGVEGGQP